MPNYPFDSFEQTVPVSVEETRRNETDVVAIPVALSLIAGVQGYKFEDSVADSGVEGFPSITLNIYFTRSFTTR
jgi:hypothetical protein